MSCPNITIFESIVCNHSNQVMFRRGLVFSRHCHYSLIRPRFPLNRTCLARFADGRRNLATDNRTQTYQSWRGMISIRALLLAAATSVGLYAYFQHEKKKVLERQNDKVLATIGRPQLGGAFSLIDHHGNRVTDNDFKGKFSLIYFGFTRCPDICPDELDKMSAAIDIVNNVVGDVVYPIFITCDPARDPPQEMAEYLEDFNPKIVGLTGSYEEIKDICKKFRVYFSTPKNIDPKKDDYLVDHSVFFYLMDPEGKFIEVFGRNSTSEDLARAIGSYYLSRKKQK